MINFCYIHFPSFTLNLPLLHSSLTAENTVPGVAVDRVARLDRLQIKCLGGSALLLLGSDREGGSGTNKTCGEDSLADVCVCGKDLVGLE